MVRVRMKYLPVVQLLSTAMWKMNWIVASQFRWYGINETSAGWSRRDFRPQTHGRSLMFLVRVFAWNHWGTLARCPRPKRLVSIYPLLSSLDLTQVPMAPVAQLFKTLKSRLGCRGPLDRMNGPRGQSMRCQWFQPYGHTCQGWNEWERSILLDHRATQQHSRRHHRILLLNHISFL